VKQIVITFLGVLSGIAHAVPGFFMQESLAKMEHLYFGVPAYNQNQLLIRTGFVLLYDCHKKSPLWVGYHMLPSYLRQNNLRAPSSAFKPDPDLKCQKQAALSDYRNSGWDRGHMTPARDMERSPKTELESFYLSNVVPENRILNRHFWAKLENLGRVYTKQFGELYIYTGPIFSKPLPGKFFYPPIGANEIPVPTWLYKIFIRRLKDGSPDLLAFEVPNQKLVEEAKIDDFLVPIETIEQDTGIHFLTGVSLPMLDLIKKRRPSKIWQIEKEFLKVPKKVHEKGNKY